MLKRLLVVTALFLTATGANAQATKYYIQNGDGDIGFIIQGGTLLSTYSLSGSGTSAKYPLRFAGGNFLSLNRDGSAGVEYDANGVPTGNTVTNSQGVDQLLDGATDGINTYAARCCSGLDGIYKGDMAFGGLTRISTLGNDGVTYASSVGHLFATDFNNVLYEMTTNGVLLNTYGLGGVGRLTALAYESSSNSLWLAMNNTNQVFNYSLTGNLINSFAVAGLGGNFFGGEMPNTGGSVAVTPEPATMTLLATGLVGLAGVRRRKRSA